MNATRVANTAAFAWKRAMSVVPLMAYRGLTGGVPILIGLYIGHRWGLIPLGAYTYASSFAAVGIVVTDWGCQRWLPRELALARSGGSGVDAVLSANTLRLILGVLYLAFTFAMYAAHAMDVATAAYAAELGLLYFVMIFSTNGVSDRIAGDEVGGIAAAVAAGVVVFLAAAVLANRAGAGPHALVAAFVGGKIVEAVVLVAGRTNLLRFVGVRIGHVARRLWPFSIQAILGVVYARLSVFVIEHLRSMSAVGIIGAASALQNVLLLVPTSTALLVYPRLTNAADDRARLRIVSRYFAISLPGIAIGVAMVWVLRSRIAAALHVPLDYAPFLVAFVAVSFLTSFTVIAGIVLQSMKQEVVVARLSFVTLGLAIAYQYFFIRAYGVWGAFDAVAAAEVTSTAVFGWAIATTRHRKHS